MEQNKKKKSRDAARQRRGQQNDEFSELASQLPINVSGSEKLDRLCVMRLSNSYIKIKHVLQQIKDSNVPITKGLEENLFNSHIQNALGGFIFVLAEDGQVLYISPNVSDNLGLQQIDITGNSIYKYVHPCDQENLAKQLGGQVPLEDMEIFDGLFCSDTSYYVKNPKQAVHADLENSQHRSFSLRMKSTLTSRGKSVNINASIYRVVHCVGTIQTYRTKLGTSNGAMTRCLLCIGTPLLSTASFEVPVDRQTFITKHSLDMKLTEVEDIACNIMGYKSRSMLNTSWYLYSHICDTKVVRDCHDTVLKKGQALSGYYRVLLKDGGWIWMQTKANVVYQSSTGQPQYIVCVHYMISDMELGDTVLSTEQYSPIKLNNKTIINKNKRNISPSVPSIKIDTNLPAIKYTKVIPTSNNNAPSWNASTTEPVYPMKTEAIQSMPFKDVMSDTSSPPLSSQDQALVDSFVGGQTADPASNKKGSGESEEDPDMPGLEFLDVEEELCDIDSTCFNDRSPFIPGPFSDFDLKNRGMGDLLANIDENELINRAPYIPPPCIDKIISFDELSLPDLEDYSDPIDQQEFLSTSTLLDSPAPSNTSTTTASSLDSNQLYDLGNAKIPGFLLKRFLPAMNGKATDI